MEAKVAQTFAPEKAFAEMLNVLNDIFKHRTGSPLFRPHEETASILRSVQRFRALEPKGIYALAKDIIHLTADSIDVEALQKIAPPPKGEKWGSIKSLEKYLATVIPAEEARKIVAPLVGAYELRIADSHLPATELQKAYELVRVNPNAPALEQGFSLIDSVVDALVAVAKTLDE